MKTNTTIKNDRNGRYEIRYYPTDDYIHECMVYDSKGAPYQYSLHATKEQVDAKLAYMRAFYASPGARYYSAPTLVVIAPDGTRTRIN